MAKHSSHIIDMARMGAEYRFRELKAEMATLVKNFPHLESRNSSHGGSAASHSGVTVASERPPVKRNLSVKARKAISDAQKRRWAKARTGAKG